MYIHSKVTYGFYIPEDAEELKKFEAETNLKHAKKEEDDIAVRYTFEWEYEKSKAPDVDCPWT